MELIRELPHQKPVILHSMESIKNVTRAMCENDAACVLLTTEKGLLEGIITSRGLVCSCLNEGVDTDLPISEIMSRDVVTVDEDATTDVVIGKMKENGFRRVPIMSPNRDHKRCVGLITLDDLLAAQVVSPADLAEIAKSQKGMRKKSGAVSRNGSQARKQQTLSLFHNLISEHLGLPKNTATRVARVIFEDIVRRVTYEEAQDFVSQLPEKWREELLDLQKGPDKSITAPLLISQVRRILNVTDDQATVLIRKFFEALSKWMSGKILVHMAAQLPKDMQDVTGLHPEIT